MLLPIIEHLPSEALAAIMILATIGTFVSIIVGVGMGINAIKSVKLANITRFMIEDLLAKGYKAEEIERLVFGESKLSKVRRMFGEGGRKIMASFQQTNQQQQMPPKQTVG